MSSGFEQAVVRIRSINGKVVGAGFVVSTRHVLTCAHVVAQALGDASISTSPEPPEAQVELNFFGQSQAVRSRVVAWRPENATKPREDIAVLELQDTPFQGVPAILNHQLNVLGHPVAVIGFPLHLTPNKKPVFYDEGVTAVGEARARNWDGWLQIGVTQQQGYSIEQGFSGAPVWDSQVGAVIGMVVAAETRPDVAEAWCIQAEVLSEILAEAIGTASPAAMPTVQIQESILFVPPKPTVRLVGREGKNSQLLQAVTTSRIVVVRGLQGAGKTALAAFLAHDSEVRRYFTDGILWAGVGNRPHIEGLLGQWTRALGIETYQQRSGHGVAELQKMVREFLHDKKFLLIIDDAPSRELAEFFRLGGPNCSHLITTTEASVSSVVQSLGGVEVELEALSVEGSRQLLDRFIPDLVSNHTELVDRIIASVGALPMALTLVGSYLGRRSAAEQEQSLKEAAARVDVIRGNLGKLAASDSAPLFIAIGLSDSVLPDRERRVLRRLSVFTAKPNTFSKAAAAEICGLAEESLDTLLQLGFVENIGGRYTLHQAIARYAQSIDVMEDKQEVEKEMVEYFIRYMEEKRFDFMALDQERENIFQALELANSNYKHVALLRGTNAIYKWAEIRGLYRLVEPHLQRAQDAADRHRDWHALVIALNNRGRNDEKLGNYESSSAHLNKSLEIGLNLYRQELCEIYLSLGTVNYNLGQYEQAEGNLKEGLRHAQNLKHQHLRCLLLQRLDLVEFCRGNFIQAMQYLSEALEIAENLESNQEVTCLLLVDQARIEIQREAYDLAHKSAERARAMADRMGFNEIRVALGLIQARLKLQERDYSGSQEDYDTSLRLAREINHRWYESLCLYERGKGYLRWKEEDTASPGALLEAAGNFRDALRVAKSIKSPDLTALSYYGLAQIDVMEGNFTQAQAHVKESLKILTALKHYKAGEVKGFARGLGR